MYYLRVRCCFTEDYLELIFGSGRGRVSIITDDESETHQNSVIQAAVNSNAPLILIIIYTIAIRVSNILFLSVRVNFSYISIGAILALSTPISRSYGTPLLVLYALTIVWYMYQISPGNLIFYGRPFMRISLKI